MIRSSITNDIQSSTKNVKQDRDHPKSAAPLNKHNARPYIGRFAPSPTGLLHIGSLVGALASYLDAKANNGLWRVRIEDLDPPREITGAADAILLSLQKHGLDWDGPILWQNQRLSAYTSALSQLTSNDRAFYCDCSRLQIQEKNGVHSGYCQASRENKHAISDTHGFAVRALIGNQSVQFNDRIQGEYKQNLTTEVGDFVLQRKDGLFAYQLAVVVDDAFQGITHVVRGSDLLDSTPRQIFLQRLLGLPTPSYCHFPVIANQQHQKLSKQTFAKAISNDTPAQNILQALAYLRQPLPPASVSRDVDELLLWASKHWSLASIPHQLNIKESPF